VASAELKSTDPAGLDAFRAELIAADFEPFGGDPRRWQGPTDPALRPFTSAETMRISFQDGWPYRPPKLFVDGIDREHTVLDGELCLFQPGEHAIGEWSTLEAYRARIKRWAETAADGFRVEDDVLDPHLYFRPQLQGIATLELESIPLRRGEVGTGKLTGRWTKGERVLALATGTAGPSSLPGRWYYNPGVSAPPRDADGFREALANGQQANLTRRLHRVQVDGASAVFALLWDTRFEQRNCLIVLATPGEEEPQMHAIELAPSDEAMLLIRAGPDVAPLSEKKVVIFGAGAIGSQLASLLARAGTGAVRMVESDVLRPGNLVRHLAESNSVGFNKAVATEVAVHDVAPWSEFESILEKPWDLERLSQLISDAELAIDATGITSFAELLGKVAIEAEVPLLSAALFRGGFLGRVRRQVPGIDTPFDERHASEEFPLIPAGEEPESFEAGCSARVNNASPVSVASIAATAASVAIDLLTERLEYEEELIDVYRPLPEPPFERIGRAIG
jgi:molybdopterin/thiamine biosynthesis adenylyltransferase